MSKLLTLIEQTEFLLEKHREAKDDCTKIFSDLLAVVEKRMEQTQGDEKEQDILGRIHDLISGQAQKSTAETQEEIEFLGAQLKAFKELQTSPDAAHRDEMVAMLLEGVEELEETETFKKEINEESLVAKQNLVAVANDLKDALEEGSTEEVEMYLTSMLEEHSDDECDECSECDEDCDACSMDDEEDAAQTSSCGKQAGCCGQEKSSCCSESKGCCSRGVDIFANMNESKCEK